MSKGSKQRPTNREKYDDNYERIFGSKDSKRADRENKEANTTGAGNIKVYKK